MDKNSVIGISLEPTQGNITANISKMSFNPHPAALMDFDDLYNKLQAEIDSGAVYCVKSQSGLEIYNYTLQCMFGKQWDLITLCSRGLILCPAEKRIVALTFPKFANFGEFSYSLPEGKFCTTAKYDGSLGIIYFFEDSWQVATRGSFQSEQCIWAKDWLNKNVDLSKLNKDNTYLAEIIYQSNRIVINYDFEGLVLLSGYNNLTGQEFSYEDTEAWGKTLGMRVTEQVQYDSIDDIIKICDSMDHNEEGFVVCFENGYRVKIKSAEYCRVHRLISNVTPLAIWDMLLHNDNMEAVRVQLPEELRNDFDQISKILSDKIKVIVDGVENFHEMTKDMSDRDLGMALSGEQFADTEAVYKKMVFLARKKDFLQKWKETDCKMRKSLFDYIRPNSNKLEGYKPSTAINRFADEALN